VGVADLTETCTEGMIMYMRSCNLSYKHLVAII